MQKGIIKNVNRITGEPINAKDLASLFSGIVGEGSGVFTVYDELKLGKIDNNRVRLHSGVYSLKGHILYIPKGTFEEFTVESGSIGTNRIDLLVAEFIKNGEGDGEDTLQFRVIQGESSNGSPQRPDLIQQDINENGITRQEVLYELRLTGLNLSIQNRVSFIKDVGTLRKETESKISDIKEEVERSVKDVGTLRKETESKISDINEEIKHSVIELPLENGWRDVSGYGQLNATKVGDIVHLFGMVSGGNSDVICTLPTKLRPQHTYRSVVLIGSGTSYCTIRPSGVVTVNDSSGRSNVSFSGVVYPLKR